MGQYKEEFIVGTTVRIADVADLECFRATWTYHNPIETEQLKHGGSLATVRKVGFYHGGDVLYELAGLSGVWHEQCLRSIARYSNRPLPPYSYVPSLSPHPVSDPSGHSFAAEHTPVQPLDESSFTTNTTYLFAVDLFNHGFYWEAHEEWERLWHTAGRRGPVADFLKGLIKLAAAGVKLREGRAAGIRQHAQRTAELIGSASGPEVTQRRFGLCPDEIRRFALEAAEEADRLIGDGKPDANRSLKFTLRLEMT